MKEQNLALLTAQLCERSRQRGPGSLGVEAIKRDILFEDYWIEAGAGVSPQHAALLAPVMPDEVGGNPKEPGSHRTRGVKVFPAPVGDRERLGRQIVCCRRAKPPGDV